MVESSALKGGHCREWWSSENGRLRMGNYRMIEKNRIIETIRLEKTFKITEPTLWPNKMPHSDLCSHTSLSLALRMGGWRTWARAADTLSPGVHLLHVLVSPRTTSISVNVGCSYLEVIIQVHLCTHDIHQRISFFFRASDCPTFASKKQLYEGKLLKGISKTLSIVSSSSVHVFTVS